MTRYHTRKKCQTGKRKYKTHLDALMGHKDGLRAYECPDCGFWHLTRLRAPKSDWRREMTA